jgi:hypothetical protein
MANPRNVKCSNFCEISPTVLNLGANLNVFFLNFHAIVSMLRNLISWATYLVTDQLASSLFPAQVALKVQAASEALLKEHYADLSTKPFFPSLIEYMKSGPVVPMVRLVAFACLGSLGLPSQTHVTRKICNTEIYVYRCLREIHFSECVRVCTVQRFLERKMGFQPSPRRFPHTRTMHAKNCYALCSFI